MLMTTMVFNVNAQEHKTYSGVFGKDNAGTATYSYYTGDDGRRMFDGNMNGNKIDAHPLQPRRSSPAFQVR